MKPLRILVLSGPTREYLDPVRYLSNASSGQQGFAIVEEALRRGHRVDLVLGPVALEPPAGASVTRVTTALEMLAAARSLHSDCDVLIGVAAVSDYRPAAPSETKHKRTNDGWQIDLVPNPDILATLGEAKGDRHHVGFALESERLIENAQRKLEAKNLDVIVANSPAAIGRDGDEYLLLTRHQPPRSLGALDKTQLAARLLDRIEAARRERA